MLSLCNSSLIFIPLLFVSCVCASGCGEEKKKKQNIFCPWAIHWKFRLTPARFDSGEMEFKTKLKVYHRLAVLASDKNDQLERQIWVDSHRGMKIARRIRLPWRFSKERAPRWQSCRCPCSSIHPRLRGLSPH